MYIDRRLSAFPSTNTRSRDASAKFIALRRRPWSSPIFATMLLPFFEKWPLASICPSDVQAWVKGRSVVLAPATIKVVHRFLSAILHPDRGRKNAHLPNRGGSNRG